MYNGFPSAMFDSITGKFLNNQFSPKADAMTVPKKHCVIVVPYLRPLSTFVNRKLKRLVHKCYPSTDPRIVYKRGNSIKKKIQCDVSGPSVVYKYIGKNYKHYSRVFLWTSDPATKESALLEHLML